MTSAQKNAYDQAVSLLGGEFKTFTVIAVADAQSDNNVHIAAPNKVDAEDMALTLFDVLKKIPFPGLGQKTVVKQEAQVPADPSRN